MKKKFLVVAFIVIVVFILSLGCFLAKRGFLSRSTSVFVKAWLGSAKAQYKLGEMYFSGLGVPRDCKKAFEWWSKAAEQGNANAQFGLGVMYENGFGVPLDVKKAAKWYSKAFELYSRAAEQGDAGAQFNLGVMYEDGLGVPKDYVQAYKWYKLAAAHGDVVSNVFSKEFLDELEREMSAEQIAEANQLVREFVAKKYKK